MMVTRYAKVLFSTLWGQIVKYSEISVPVELVFATNKRNYVLQKIFESLQEVKLDLLKIVLHFPF